MFMASSTSFDKMFHELHFMNYDSIDKHTNYGIQPQDPSLINMEP